MKDEKEKKTEDDAKDLPPGKYMVRGHQNYVRRLDVLKNDTWFFEVVAKKPKKL